MAKRINKKISDVDGSDGKGPNRRERRQILKKQIKESGMPGPRVAYKRYGPGILTLEKNAKKFKEEVDKAQKSIEESKKNPSEESVSKAEEAMKIVNKAGKDAEQSSDQVVQYDNFSNREQRQARREYKRNIQFPEGETSETLKAERNAGREERRAGRQEGRDARFNERQARRDERNNVPLDEEPKLGQKISAALNSAKSAITGGTVAANEGSSENASATSNVQASPAAEGFSTAQPQAVEKTEALVQQNNNSIPTAGQIVANAAANSTDTDFTQQNQVVEDSKDLNQEQSNLQTQVVDGAANAVNEIETSPVTTKEYSGTASSAPITTEGSTETEIIPGDGKTAVTAQGPVVGAKPTYLGTTTRQQIANGIANSAAIDVDNVPGLVLDKLQPHDYYPNLSKDINVGTYSGKYLGSVTLFAAPGARLPMGLYDARKRALVEQAKAKQAEIDKFLTIPETDKLYQAEFSESFLNEALGYLQKHKFNMTALKRDPEALQFFARYQAKAKEITAATAFADSIITKSQDKSSYVPKHMRDNAYDVKMNLLNRTADILAAKESAIKPIQDAKVYSNLIPQVDALTKELLDPNRMSQAPLKLKSVSEAEAEAMRRGEKFDAAKYEKERNDFIAGVNDMNANTDTYVTGVRKFFGGNYSDAIDALIDAEPNSNEAQADALKEYFAAQIQPQEILKYTTAQNANQWQAFLAEKKRQYNTTRADNQNNLWGGINESSKDAIHSQTGKSFNQEMAELEKKNLTGAALKREIARISQTYKSGSAKSYLDPVSNTYTNFVPASNALLEKGPSLKPTVDGRGNATIKTAVRIYDGKKWLPTAYYSPEQIANINNKYKSKGWKLYDGETGKQYTKDDLKAFDDVKSGNVFTQVVGHEIRNGYTDEGGYFHYLDPNGSNLKQYNASKNKSTVAVPVSQAFVRTEVEDDVTKQKVYKDTPVPGRMREQPINVSNSAGQALLNEQYGYDPQKGAEAARVGETWDYSGTGSGFSVTTNPGGVVTPE